MDDADSDTPSKEARWTEADGMIGMALHRFVFHYCVTVLSKSSCGGQN